MENGISLVCHGVEWKTYLHFMLMGKLSEVTHFHQVRTFNLEIMGCMITD
jgi:uncharacterized membrane protein